jgi:hypothetical protein
MNIQNHHVKPPGIHQRTAKAMKAKATPMKMLRTALSIVAGSL